MRNIFKEYDSQVPPQLAGIVELQKKHIAGSGWTEHDGDFPGHFRDRKAHTCLWSCNWQTSDGVLTPDAWYPVDRMKSRELIAEGKDYVYRVPQHFVIQTKLTPMILDFYSGEVIPDPVFFCQKLADVLRGLRQGLNEDFVCTWDAPDASVLVQKIYRPGWNVPIKTSESKYTPVQWSTGVHHE